MLILVQKPISNYFYRDEDDDVNNSKFNIQKETKTIVEIRYDIRRLGWLVIWIVDIFKVASCTEEVTAITLITKILVGRDK